MKRLLVLKLDQSFDVAELASLLIDEPDSILLTLISLSKATPNLDRFKCPVSN
jgi:hypothetical protein